MECELWPQLYASVMKVGKELRRNRVRYSDAAIVLVFLWGCLHDRPQCWACDAGNWRSTRLRPVRLPSDSTLSRCLESPSVKRFMKQLEHEVRCPEDSGLTKCIDAKPLPVGPCTKDPEAKAGRAVGGMARGYKLYAICGNRAFPESWSVHPLNKSEISVAKALIPQITGGRLSPGRRAVRCGVPARSIAGTQSSVGLSKALPPCPRPRTRSSKHSPQACPRND